MKFLQKFEFPYLYEYVTAITSQLIILSVSLLTAWPSPVLPQLIAIDSPIPMTSDEGRWIPAILTLGCGLGPVPAMWLVDVLGRKRTLLLSSVPVLLGWAFILLAETLTFILIGRFLGGLGYGIALVAAPMYLGEISSDAVRGSIGTLLSVMAKIGIVYVYTLGPYVNFRLLSWLSSLPVILFIMTFTWLPESPYFLVDKDRDEARDSLKFLRGTKDVENELEMISNAVEKANSDKKSFRILFSKGSRKRIIIITGLGLCQILSGSQYLIAYSQRIFQDVEFLSFSADQITIIIGIVQLISAGLSTTIVDHVGRRPLLIVSCAGTVICNGMACIYFTFDNLNFNVASYSIVPMLAVIFYFIFFTVGVSTVTFSILSEIFPKNTKALASGFFNIVTSLVNVGVQVFFQMISDSELLGLHVTFGIFSCFTLIFLIFICLIVPETKGRSLDEILKTLNGNNKKLKQQKTDKDAITSNETINSHV